jgi:hypothetical protein
MSDKQPTVLCAHCGGPVERRSELAVISVARYIRPFHDRCVEDARPRALYKFTLRINSRRFYINLVLVNLFILLPFLFLPFEDAAPLLIFLAVADVIMGGMRLVSYLAYERKLPE